MKNLFPSLPDDPKLRDVFTRFPATFAPLMEFHDRVLRADGPLTIGEREMIAAYVSGLNACRFCLDAHEAFARAHGIDPDVLASILDDPTGDAVPPRLRPILAYVRKLTLEPSKMTEADAKAVYDAGWTEEALFSAIQTCAIFNLMNRIVEGTGVTPFMDDDDKQAKAPPRMESYTAFAKTLGLT